MITFGNSELLKREKVAFLSSRRVPPEVVGLARGLWLSRYARLTPVAFETV